MLRYPKATIAGGIVFGVFALAIAFLLLFDFKGFTERRASAALGRPVTIGSMELKIFPLEAVLQDLNVADVPLGQTPPAGKAPFMKAAHVDAVVGFWRLLAGDLLFKHLTVEDAVARIERRPDGSLTWEIQRPQDDKGDAPELPEIRDLNLRNVVVHYRDDSTDTQLTLDLETRQDEGREPTLVVKGKGTYAGQPSTVSGVGGSILALREEDKAYPIDGTLVSGPTTVTVKGTVVDPANLTGLNVAMTVKGQDAADLYRVAGVALPPTPPYSITTHVDREGARWIFKDFKWVFGKSDLSGQLVWDRSTPMPMLTGDLRGKVVALKDLGGFVGAAPGDAKTPVAVQRAAADQERERRAQGDKPAPIDAVAPVLIIPDRPIDFQKLNSMNAKIHLEAAKVIEAGFPLDSFTTDVTLNEGVITLKPLLFKVDKGEIAIELTINGKEQPMKADAVAVVKGYPLQRLLAKEGGDKASWGAIGGRVELHGTGNSLHTILANSNGDVGLAVGGGQISLLVVEMMGVDLAEALGIMLTKDKPTQIRCIVADFGIQKGLMTARNAVADTNDTIFTGTGTIDLGGEMFDMRVRVRPKDVSPVSLRSKLLLTGSFANPSFGPDPKNIILKGGAAVVLGVVLTPIASLIALIDGGGGKDADCAALIQEAAKQN